MNKKARILILTFILILLISFGGIVLAENINDLQNQKNQLQEQITQASDKIEDIKIELTENLEQLNNLNSRISTYENEIASLEDNLDKVSKDITTVTDKLNIIEENYTIQKETLQNRILAIYETGDVYYLDVLLQSNSIIEFISNYYLIGKIAKYDSDLLDNIERQKNQIEVINQALTERQDNLETLKKNKEKTTISLENSKIIRNSYIAKLSNDEKSMQEKIDKYQSELNNLESQITALTSLSIGENFVGGEFIWPAPGYTTITSRYGMRFHPILKVNRLHTGTDIGMPTGAYVVASNDGVVIQASYVTGYGNTIMIDHGGGIVTLYGHASELIAQLGQTVKKGDLIMKAGSTGWSTGPHLHFEVRINGTAIDSMKFLQEQANYVKQDEELNTQANEENNIVNGGES